MLPSGQALGYQQMRVGEDGPDATLDNALSMCGQFGLARDAAQREMSLVVRTVAGWREHFAGAGVTRKDLELLDEQIERPFLLEQRKELRTRRRGS